jgi:hypothetical protein
MNRVHLLLIVLLAVVAVPFAAADTIQLTSNNLGISGSIGSVTLTQQGGGVMVTLSANSGYSLKLNGGDILFNTNASLSAGSISQLMIDGKYTSNFAFMTGVTRAGNTFSYDLANLMKGTLPHGYVSATTISFFVSGVTLSQLEQGNWGVHFCVGGGTNCGTGVTGFATGRVTVVPEPGTLSLLGTGILGLAGFMRRRLFA